MKIGYARVSTQDQKAELQIDALEKAGCQKIYLDKESGSKSSRPELDRLKDSLRAGDTLCVYRLDRLGRSLKDLISWMQELDNEGINFESLQEKIDTSTPTGKLIFHIFGAIAEFERDLIRERTNAGLTAARARGRKGGRKPKLSEEKRKALCDLYTAKNHSIKSLCEMFSISRKTLYRTVNPER